MRWTVIPLFLLFACGGEPTGPLGPSGGENRFRVEIGEDQEPFDLVNLQIDASSTTAITLRLVGSVDPIENAIDDEYGLNLEIDLDRDALLTMAVPQTLLVKGESRFEPADEAGNLEQYRYQRDPSASPIPEALFFRRSCFCGNQDSGTQKFDGSIQVQQLSADEITGSLSIHLTGDVPNYTDPLDATLTAEFNLSIP